MKTITDLRLKECRWPVGQHEGRHIFCAEATPDPAASYCPHHHSIAYLPETQLALADEEARWLFGMLKVAQSNGEIFRSQRNKPEAKVPVDTFMRDNRCD